MDAAFIDELDVFLQAKADHIETERKRLESRR